MSFEVKNISVPSTDNIHTLQGKIYIPEGEIKGILHVIHGMTEHIERYDSLMSYFADCGFVTFGYDNLGHGKTAKDETELGFIAYHNGWRHLINDVNAFEEVVKKLYPQLPLYLFGHSMGSFIARIAFESFPQNYKKVIFCGTAGKNPLSAAGLLLTDLIGLFKGKRYVSRLVCNMALGSYNKKFGKKGGREWLTNNTEIVEKYAKDKFCNYKFTVSAMHDLIKLISLCNRKKWFENVSKEIPIFLVAGADDPVGNYGKGVKWVYNKLIKQGADSNIKLYENCRHEIHNDTCREEVFTTLAKFLNSK